MHSEPPTYDSQLEYVQGISLFYPTSTWTTRHFTMENLMAWMTQMTSIALDSGARCVSSSPFLQVFHERS
jgi:hypothetical protein